jgi:hypothetical protein
MTRPDPPTSDERPTERAQYGQFTAGDALIVYDREDTSRWIESDYTVDVADMR